MIGWGKFNTGFFSWLPRVVKRDEKSGVLRQILKDHMYANVEYVLLVHIRSISVRCMISWRSRKNLFSVELQWLEHVWDHGKLFEPMMINHGARSGSKYR